MLTPQNSDVSYPPTRHRPNPQRNGSDLLGRFFCEPELGVCCITRLGTVTQKQLPSRAQTRVDLGVDKPIALGAHNTLYYTCVMTNDEYFSSIDEIKQWIRNGPVLQPPTVQITAHPNVTAPPYAVPQEKRSPDAVSARAPQARTIIPTQEPNQDTVPSTMQPSSSTPPLPSIVEPAVTIPEEPPLSERRQSTRKRVPRDLLKPTHHGKAYSVSRFPRKQRVPVLLTYPGKQRMSPTEIKHQRFLRSKAVPNFKNTYMTVYR